ncbi:hypothetical protein HYPSUDRAFT_203859 [Hypholoma sublateritium FD-334 SS-4]|uniref:Uncharacterized protein n=1 Tax=Hypholoma sublateritium (strain FD-334 SS-4) TaxID=945553 RepID=A0A0D2NNG5_HYPSF|nr:hypothetical protein HYPSUDRAFT_203859 [Hypholoma sublateritium FD-334 SS-4]
MSAHATPFSALRRALTIRTYTSCPDPRSNQFRRSRFLTRCCDAHRRTQVVLPAVPPPRVRSSPSLPLTTISALPYPLPMINDPLSCTEVHLARRVGSNATQPLPSNVSIARSPAATISTTPAVIAKAWLIGPAARAPLAAAVVEGPHSRPSRPLRRITFPIYIHRAPRDHWASEEHPDRLRLRRGRYDEWCSTRAARWRLECAGISWAPCPCTREGRLYPRYQNTAARMDKAAYMCGTRPLAGLGCSDDDGGLARDIKTVRVFCARRGRAATPVPPERGAEAAHSDDHVSRLRCARPWPCSATALSPRVAPSVGMRRRHGCVTAFVSRYMRRIRKCAGERRVDMQAKEWG